MKIKKVKDKKEWENLLLDCKEKTFLSSWNWGEFEKKMGRKIWRLGLFENNSLKMIALVVKINAKRGNFLFLPHNPTGKFNSLTKKEKALKLFISKVKKIAQEESDIIFIRIAPIWDRNNENRIIFQRNNFKQAPIHKHPELTWQLNLEPSKEELLMNMRKTTRRLIRKGRDNENLKIIKTNNFEEVKTYNKLYQKTADRHDFVPFSLKYLKNEFSVFNEDDQILIFLAKYKEEIISAAMIIYWSGIGFYHQGASIRKYSKIPTSYLLQWEAIKEAKKRGCTSYNFWGIAPTDDPNHPWHGLTKFKKGFGGEKLEYTKTQDYSLSFKYHFTYLIEKIRKIRRGF